MLKEISYVTPGDGWDNRSFVWVSRTDTKETQASLKVKVVNNDCAVKSAEGVLVGHGNRPLKYLSW